MYLIPEDLFKIVLAVLVGGLIGLERELRDKAAGFRTMIFISIGAAMFMIFSAKFALDKDPTRIAAGVVTGIGFIGAGVIMRESGKITGLTTAATIWMTAALGMGIGGGQYILSGVATLLALVVLWLFPGFEHWLTGLHDEHSYRIVYLPEAGLPVGFEDAPKRLGFKLIDQKVSKSSGRIVYEWRVSGSRAAHEALRKHLQDDRHVITFSY